MTAYYNEHDRFAAAWLRELIREGLIADGHVDERDIQDVRPDDLRGYAQCHFFAGIGGWSLALQLAGWGAAEVWTGSCPCQPFSAAGRGKGFGDPRHLWPTWLRLIKECRPSVIFGEQVASSDGLAWFDHVSTDMEAQDYAIGAADICAAGIGAPHIRQRLWFVADTDRNGFAGETPRETAQNQKWHMEAHRPIREAELRSALSGLQPSWPAGPGWVDKVPIDADGISDPVVGLRGPGNAIVPQVAAEFVRAYLEARA